ncbi:hypothetical protein MAPG_01082 [Magnaporthiopsis poae ATCC 64411]|uniref:Uncharacterized protein n=1 Tax=Magnaporthiopsis poae (strain ATCC 64411 / 73-15) TaxID=644358 RepID=A0A0C4DMS0_MAGP6|nr:hypothetical protein MAPG_01082 [Magnaporthiopsis poae ATCC 64411]
MIKTATAKSVPTVVIVKKTGREHNTVNTALGKALRAAEDKLDEHRAYPASHLHLAPTDKTRGGATALLNEAKTCYEPAHAVFGQKCEKQCDLAAAARRGNQASLTAPAERTQHGAEATQPNDGAGQQDGVLNARLRDCLIMWMARAVYEFGAEALSRGWGEGSTILDV